MAKQGGALLSVVMPAYNAEPFIGAAIESVLGQRHTPLELLVVDDGSTDGTARIVTEHARRDSRVRLLQQPNLGVAAARNAGIAAARGAFVAPLDADDVWFPDTLALAVARLAAAAPRVGVVYVWSAHMDERGEFTGGYSAADEEGDVYAALVLGNFIGNASATLLRRDCLERCGGYDASFRARGGEGCEDTDLYLRLARHYHFARVPRLLVGYRQRAASLSAHWMRMARSHRLVLERVQAAHPGAPRCIGHWSRAALYRYLAWQCARADDAWGALRCLARAGLADPHVCAEARYRRSLQRTLRAALRGRRAAAPRRAPTLDEVERSVWERRARAHRDPRAGKRLAQVRRWLSGGARLTGRDASGDLLVAQNGRTR